MLLSAAPLHLLCQNDQNEVKHDSVHLIPLAVVVPIVLKMASFYSLGQDN